jgi:beta-phosphoglucomutase-like phosphatase (HAD superfamily)
MEPQAYIFDLDGLILDTGGFALLRRQLTDPADAAFKAADFAYSLKA